VKTHRGGEKEQHACLASAGWKMLKILKTYRIPPHLLGVTKSTYTNTTSCVVPPLIFIIVLNYTHVNPHEDLGFTITPSKSRRVGPVHLSHPDVADDTEDAQELVARVEWRQCNKVGLHLNATKTESMAYRPDHDLDL